MKARMKNNLILRYQLCPEFDYRIRGHIGQVPNELIASRLENGWQSYFDTKEFLKSIEGRIVELTFTCGDAFEAKDNNHWLPNSLWEKVI